ncbi:MAG: hypothetical protein KIC55_07930 [Lachnoanaerobaculum sp.]|jgi:hypothetical protein|uniref:hypothetical protein n=1 Tax=Lachnoanaerobaculum sp. TaxID=2049030 RepID=UPI0025C43409|nr:hypothetical protein [Lachnoanaerobaculum sp.]MBS5882309.1 hypothetical protein [Lachnoanaerobaculum sp.]
MREEPKWYREEESILYSEYMNLPVDVLPNWSDFIKEHGTKRFVEYTDESDSRYAELAARGIYED